MIKNPIEKHLPIGCRKYLTTFNCQNLVSVKELVKPEDDEPVVMVSFNSSILPIWIEINSRHNLTSYSR